MQLLLSVWVFRITFFEVFFHVGSLDESSRSFNLFCLSKKFRAIFFGDPKFQGKHAISIIIGEKWFGEWKKLADSIHNVSLRIAYEKRSVSNSKT